MNTAKVAAKLYNPHFVSARFQIFVIEENLFRMKPFEAVELNVEDAQEMRSVFKELSKGQKYGILIDGTNFFTSTSDVRKLIANREYSAHRYATALVTNLLANRIFGNFFLSFNKPSSPTRIFNDEEQALNWIRKHKGML